MKIKVRTCYGQAIEDLQRLANSNEDFELNLTFKDDIKIVLEEIERLNNIINKIKECLSKNRVYITGERNLAFELDEILKGEDE